MPTWQRAYRLRIGIKSAVNRYAIKMNKIGAKLQQSRQIADMWIANLGSQPSGQVGMLLNEVVRNLAFDAALQMSEDAEPAHPKLIKELAIAIERLEKAAGDNEKRAAEIRKQARLEAAEQAAAAAKAAEPIAKKAGLSDDDWAAIRAKFLGVEVEQ